MNAYPRDFVLAGGGHSLVRQGPKDRAVGM